MTSASRSAAPPRTSTVRGLFAVTALLTLVACASTSPHFQRLRVKNGDTEQVFETVALVVSRHYPVAVRDPRLGIVDTRYMQKRGADGSVLRWKGTAYVRSEKQDLIIGFRIAAEEISAGGVVPLGSLEDEEHMVLTEIESRLRAAYGNEAVQVERLEPVEIPVVTDPGSDGQEATTSTPVGPIRLD